MVSGKGALTGAAAGAAVGSIVPLVGTGVGAALGGLGGLFMGGNKKDDKLEDLRTPQQIEAAKILQQLGTTGSGGGINLGEAYGGSLGSFDPTQFEQQGLSQLFGQQPNAALSQAEDVFGKLSGAAFDPNQLEPFRKAAVRSEGQALDRLSQSKAATGSRFGTGFGRDASSLIFGMGVGCGIDANKYAFAYGKGFRRKPIVSCGVVSYTNRGLNATVFPMKFGV